MKKELTFAIAALALYACATPYEQFYMPLVTPAQQAALIVRSDEPPTLVTSTGSAERDQEIMYSRGFLAIGAAAFNGPAQNAQTALVEAKKVGGRYVVVSARYSNTVSGALPLTLPTTTTVTTSGSVGGTLFNANSEVSGSRTTYIPYSVSRYDQEAGFYAELVKVGLGALLRAPTPDEVRANATNRGGIVRAVRSGSPAFSADILPGDLLLSVDGRPVDPGTNAMGGIQPGQTVSVVLQRNGQVMTKQIPIIWN